MRSDRKALIIGVQDYKNLGKLKYCKNDAQLIAEALQEYNCQFSCTVLLDEEATAVSIRTTFKELFDQADSTAIIIFYYAGHGVTIDNSTFLVTLDSEDDLEAGVDLQRLVTIVKSRMKPEQTCIFLLDCCHSGAMNIENLAISVDNIQDTIISASRGITLIAATEAENKALENESVKQGVFTNWLFYGLSGDAANSDGDVTASSLQEFVAKRINEYEPSQQVVYKTNVIGESPVLGSGYLPRYQIEESRLGEGKKQEIYAKIEGRLKLAESQLGHYHSPIWANKYHAETSRDISDLIIWRETLERSHPELRSDEKYLRYERTIRDIQVKLSNVTPNTVLPYGSVDEEVGQGGFGTVYKVDTIDGIRAYKIYHANQLHEKGKVKAFLRGYNAMRKLNHPYIVRVFEETKAPLGFYMQFIKGQNFRNWWYGDLQKLLNILHAIAQILEYAHIHGVIHRDIKPENIIIDDSNNSLPVPYLTDFDLAWYDMATTYTTVGSIAAFGHYLYAAPEQYERPGADMTKKPTADIYGFGQLCYFAVVGQDPVNDTNNAAEHLQAHIGNSDEWVSAEAADLFVKLYKKCVQRTPANRYQSMEEISGKLLQIRNLIIDPDRDKSISKEKFLDELIFSIFGFNTPRNKERFDSKTGRTSINLAELSAKRIDIKFGANQGYSGAAGTFEQQRNVIHRRVDTALQVLEKEVDFLEFRRNNENLADVYNTSITAQGRDLMTLNGAEVIRRLIVRIIGAIEM